MADDNDILPLVDDHEPRPEPDKRRWKVAIIDDDPAVHEGTRFALGDYSLNGQGLELISAYSAAEGRNLLRANPDVAAVLLDVIMETDDSGLELVEFVRNELKNEMVRIILRTGQPGQAPERRVIVDYDINDYKAKTELTADKLFTSLTAALRSYQQLQRMEHTRRGLEIIIDAASTLYDFRSMQRLAEGVLTQIASLLNVDCAGILVLRDSGKSDGDFSVLAASGCYSRFAEQHGTVLDQDLRPLVEAALQRRHHDFEDRRTVLYISTASGREIVVLLEAERPISGTDRTLVEIFASRLSVAFDNVILYDQLQQANTQLEARVALRTRELTSANKRLAAQWSRLQRANALKSEILGAVAHDLKNPLAVILGRTEMLLEMVGKAASSPENIKAQINHIRTSANRLTSMVNNLIADAMADALDITVRPEMVDVAVLVREVAASNQPLADNKKQTISISVAADCPANCDSDRIREAIDNLLSNAIKYSPIGGHIELRVSRSEGEEAVIEVQDEGAGLSPEDMVRLFERFQRLSAQPTAGESSTGLGLSIAKRIVELHGGTIRAESPGPGRGSTFIMRLPAS